MKNRPISLKFLLQPAHFCALGFGSGLCPIMPGTCGTIVAIPIYLLLQHLPVIYYAVVVAIMIVAGFWLCDITCRDLGVHDHSSVVWDEIVGYLLTMLAVPHGWTWIVSGFLLFRLFDIWKPWPIKWLDKNVSGGIGVVLDDLVAAAFALFVLQFFAVVIPLFLG